MEQYNQMALSPEAIAALIRKANVVASMVKAFGVLLLRYQEAKDRPKVGLLDIAHQLVL